MGKHIRITLNPEERAEIEARIRKTSNRAIADRLRVILYKADGRTHQEIADLLQIQSINTITTWLQVYVEGGGKRSVPGTTPARNPAWKPGNRRPCSGNCARISTIRQPK